jgi:hypothetical protein
LSTEIKALVLSLGEGDGVAVAVAAIVAIRNPLETRIGRLSKLLPALPMAFPLDNPKTNLSLGQVTLASFTLLAAKEVASTGQFAL